MPEQPHGRTRAQTSQFAGAELAEAIVETLHEPLLVLNADLRVVLANPAFYEHFQVSPDATIDRKVYDLGNGQWDIPALRKLLDDVLPANNVFNDFLVEHDFDTLGRRIMLVNARRLTDQQLVLLGIHDITERTTQERELAEAREYAEKIVDTFHEPLLVLHPDLTVKGVNRAFYDQFEATPEQTIGHKIYDLGNGQWDIPALRTLLEDVLPDSNVFNDYEVRHEFEDIGERIMLLNARRLDHVQLILLGIRDITRKEQAADRLRESESRARRRTAELEGVMATVPGIVLIAHDDQCQRITGNPAAYEYLRAPAGCNLSLAGPAGIGKSFVVLQEGAELTTDQLPLRRAARGETLHGIEIEHRFPDGASGFIFGGAAPLHDEAGKPAGAVAAFVDITERKRAEAERRESDARYRLLFDSIEDGFCVFEMILDDPSGLIDYRFIEANPAFERVTGLKDVIGKRMRELRPEHEQVWFDVYAEVARTGKPRRFTQSARELGGRTYDLYAFRVGEPEDHGVAVLFEDISARLETEAALRESEERYRLLVEGAREYAIFMIDPEGRITSWNSGATRVFGYDTEEIIGQSASLLFPDDDTAGGDFARELREAGESGSASGMGWRLRKDGSRFWATGVMTALRNGDATRGFVKVLRDDTAAKRHEQQLETIMQELNHRVKNLLAVVHATAEQTIRHSANLDEFRRTFAQRLRSMGKAHSLLTHRDWEGVALDELLASELDRGPSGSVTLDGPVLLLKPDAALTLHMVIHELATNAVKYGALAAEGGSVSVAWSLTNDPSPVLRLRWEEHGGPAASPPKRTGYGTALIDSLLSYQLKGSIERDYAPTGFCCDVALPWNDNVGRAEPPGPASS